MATNGHHNHNHQLHHHPRRHVAVCAFPFGTHAAPLLLLVKRLAAAAPDVRFSFLNTTKSNSLLFKAINVSGFPNIVPCSIMPDDHDKGDGGHHHLKAIGVFLQAAPDGVRRGVAEIEAAVGVAVSCLITDAFLWFCGEIADKKGVPWVPLWTASSASLSVHVHTDDLRNKFGTHHNSGTCHEKIADCIPGMSNVRISDLPLGVVFGDLDSPFSKMLHNMGLVLPKASAVVINSFEELLPAITRDLKSKMRCLLNVGPFALTSPPQVESDQFGCLEWMDQHKVGSVAYISFGTVATPSKEEIIALAESLEATGVPFIWSLKDSAKAQLPLSFMKRIESNKTCGMVISWAPQLKLLAHPSMGVFITHCGWNSIMESIVNGVPLICRPILGDQVLNQRLIESVLKFGTGIEGGTITKSGTMKALHQVLSSHEGKQMRSNVKVLKELAEQGIRSGSTSNENFKVLIELVTGPTNGRVVENKKSEW
ncbi:hypothetical protein Cgig2_016715 [Carnegiea gigantea]|uniref:Glycosyltransferase n=1 Tax=Carnegiea gigantea TaxID=171969 RepID=A0A9Q1KYP7_9CARY|nr:hypothetical protein Cgig2_016715 [Carnegiea gigantea]